MRVLSTGTICSGWCQYLSWSYVPVFSMYFRLPLLNVSLTEISFEVVGPVGLHEAISINVKTMTSIESIDFARNSNDLEI